MSKSFISSTLLCLSIAASGQPVPSPRQLKHDMEFYLFAHFGPNTFTDLEWGKGNEQEEVFNPTNLNCGQWCRTAIAAGAKGIIITAKHHDGFCLWPSKYSTHTIAKSSWKNGKGDILRDLSDSCKKYGLKFGVYLSPWDRNHPNYGTPEYNDVYVNMMKEIVMNYGPLFEFWWDGANGEGPNGKKQVYDWHLFEETLRRIAPNTVVFSDIGPDLRWVGNESGFAGDPNWNLLDTAGFLRGAGSPSTDSLNHGNINGANWIPAECDVSIRPGWFYHKNEDEKVKTPEALFQLYLKSVGRGASLLLNVPPDREGLINTKDSMALVGFKKLRDNNFGLPIGSKKFTKKQTNYTLKLLNSSSINCIVLYEPIQMGQKIIAFTVRMKKKNEIIKEITAKTIGKKRILTFPSVKVDMIEVIITAAKPDASIDEIQAFQIAGNLIERN
jgi:alpha-L-fucosidase